MKKITPQQIWQEYEKDKAFKISLNLYEKTKQQENFFLGRQWEGLNAPDLEKPVLNFIKKVVNFLVSMLVVNDISISFGEFLPMHTGKQMPDKIVPNKNRAANEKILSQEMERINEATKFKTKLKTLIKNAAVDGDTCMYLRYSHSPDYANQGEIESEIVENTRIAFGNPYINTVDEQPYIIIIKNMLTQSLKEQYPNLADKIRSDSENTYSLYEENTDNVTTVLIRMWKQDGNVFFCESTREVMLKPVVNTMQKLYPIVYMSWENVKNCCHGMGAVESIIPNQIAVNKLWAMALLYQKNNAFPKIFIDKTKIEKWTSKVGAVIGVVGNPTEAFATSFRPADMSNQLMMIVEKTISYTKDFMGANDASLGNVSAVNTSAIVTLQKSSSAPLELQKLALYQFIEDYARIVFDIIRVNYGLRYVTDIQQDQTECARLVDFTQLNVNSKLKVDIGPSQYWSEAAQISTMDNLFKQGIITDAVTYLENLPEKALPNKNKLIRSIKELENQSQQKIKDILKGEIA